MKTANRRGEGEGNLLSLFVHESNIENGKNKSRKKKKTNDIQRNNKPQ